MSKKREEGTQMDLATARRCVSACAGYFRLKDDSPRAAHDLEEAVRVIEAQAEARGYERSSRGNITE